MRVKKLKKIFVWAIFFGGFAAAAAIIAHDAFYGNAFKEEVSIYITPQTEYNSLKESIEPSITSNLKVRAFNFYASHLNLENRIKTGHYRIGRGKSVIDAVRMLVLGEQTPINLVIGNARTLPQLASKISKQIMADSAAIIGAMYDKTVRESLGYKKDSLIAMFIPNTYQVYWNITPQSLLQRMGRESNAFWTEARKAKLKAAKLTQYQTMTLASIVYEETKNRGEMPRIAGVYINRLRKNMPLQACPTVKYAMGDFSLTRILHRHLRYDSPFNTYRNAGLPPAPICIPSMAAIESVLNYENSDYLFFCAKPEFDGTHNFARTLREHNANSRKYNEALKRRKK